MAALFTAPAWAGSPAFAQDAPPPDDAPSLGTEYRLYVANESSDIVSRVVFRPGAGAEVEKEIPVGIMPADNDGAHGLTVSPDGAFWYLTIAHGTPYGYVWKFAAGADTLVSRAELGLFPATMGVTPNGQFLVVANFNLHGDMVPSDLSVVHTPTMTQLSRVTTCLMPHGSRVSASGGRQYSACMHSDQLVELDLTTLEVSRRFSVAPGREGPLDARDQGMGAHVMVDDGAGGSQPAMRDDTSTGAMGGMAMDGAAAACSPTWAEPGAGEFADRVVYVACNRNDEILEIDAEDWRVRRRFATGAAPYNLEVTADGALLVATLKGEQAVAVISLGLRGGAGPHAHHPAHHPRRGGEPGRALRVRLQRVHWGYAGDAGRVRSRKPRARCERCPALSAGGHRLLARDPEGANAMKRAVPWAVAVGVALFLGYVMYSSVAPATVNCEVCLVFDGEEVCRMGAGPTAEAAAAAAQESVCGGNAMGMIVNERCRAREPERLTCSP